MESYLEGIRVIIITDKDLSKMKNRENIYVDENLGILAYSYSFSTHQQCFEDFGEAYNYEYSDKKSLIQDNNICFEVAGPIDGKYVVVNYLPDKMNDKILAGYLEVINKMKDDKLYIFEAQKINEKEQYQYFKDFNENIYCDIVCSYLEKTKNK